MADSEHRDPPPASWYRRRTVGTGVLLSIGAAALTGAGLYFWNRRRVRRHRRTSVRHGDGPRQPTQRTPPADISGLTAEEAARRLVNDPEAQRTAVHLRARRTVLRRNTFSIFNATLLGLTAAIFLLGDPLGAVLTLVLLFFNIGINVLQQLLAGREIDRLSYLARPAATAIRDGEPQRIDYLQAVEGDVILFGPGDEFISRGILLTEEPILVAQSRTGHDPTRRSVHRRGDMLPAGDICVQGAGCYRLLAAPSARMEAVVSIVPETRADLTPLQRLMDTILRALIALLAVFAVFMVLDVTQMPFMTPGLQRLYREIASTIFSLAPSGLFFAVLVAYALGAGLLARRGALVTQSSIVEALAQTTVICFGKSGVLTNTRLAVDIAGAAAPAHAVPAGRVMHLLGVFAHSVRSETGLTRFIAEHTDGAQHRPVDEVSYAAGGDWQAITLSDPEMRGTYVLGTADGLHDLVAENALSRLPQMEGSTENEEAGPDVWWRHPRRWWRARRQPPEGRVVPSGGEEEAPLRDRRFLFAYAPEPLPLHDATGRPLLPATLTPLAYLGRAEEARAGAKRAIRAFTDAGVAVKVVAADPVEAVLALLQDMDLVAGTEAEQHPEPPPNKQAPSRRAYAEDAGNDPEVAVVSGFPRESNGRAAGERELHTLTGRMFETLEHTALVAAVAEADVIAGVTPAQREFAVQLLQNTGESVTVVGNSVADTPAMEQATLSVSLHTGSQATLRHADVILMHDTLGSLAEVLLVGQRVVNGLLNTLRLNLTQVGYVLLLIASMILSDASLFYYNPSQGGVVVVLTLVVPSIALTLWARAGAVTPGSIYRRLSRFVIPASVTMALSVLVVNRLMLAYYDVTYSRLVVTTLLMMEGLVLVVFAQADGTWPARADDRPPHFLRTVCLSVGLFVLYLALSMLPLTQNWFKLGVLNAIQHYLLLLGITCVWALLLQGFWHLRRKRRQPARSI